MKSKTQTPPHVYRSVGATQSRINLTSLTRANAIFRSLISSDGIELMTSVVPNLLKVCSTTALLSVSTSPHSVQNEALCSCSYADRAFNASRISSLDKPKAPSLISFNLGRQNGFLPESDLDSTSLLQSSCIRLHSTCGKFGGSFSVHL